MLRNYFTVAFRALWKSKSFSGLNIVGLSLGIACGLLILLWVRIEKSVDAFHANKCRQYVLYERRISPQKVSADYDSPAAGAFAGAIALLTVSYTTEHFRFLLSCDSLIDRPLGIRHSL